MRRVIACSFLFVLLYPTAIDLYLVGLPQIAADLGASTNQLHFAFSIYLAGMAATMGLAGGLADRFGRKPVVCWGALLFTLASLLAAYVSTPASFFAARFFQGVGAGGCYVVAFAILRDVLQEQQRAKVLSMLNGITCILPVLAPVIGHLIMLQLPWPSLFITMAIIGTIATVVALFGYQETRPQRPTLTPATLVKTESLAQPLFVSRVAISAIAITAILTYVNVSPMLIMEQMGLSRGQYSLVMTSTALVGMTISLLSPWIIAKVQGKSLMYAAQIIFVTAAILLFVASDNQLAIKVLAFGLISLGFSVGFGVVISQALRPFHYRAALASSVMAVSQICCASGYIWLMGMLSVSPLQMLIISLACGGVISMVLISMTPIGAPNETPCPTRS